MKEKTASLRRCRTWKVVLESEPFGREVLVEDSSAIQAFASLEKLVLDAEKEYRNDKICREVSLVCSIGADE
jgi:hypothetical protein